MFYLINLYNKIIVYELNIRSPLLLLIILHQISATSQNKTKIADFPPSAVPQNKIKTSFK